MTEWTNEAFNRFWAKMLGIYGKRWADDHGAKMNETWREMLEKMSLERAAAAISVCIDSNDAHPITLSQFVSRAKTIKLHGAHADYQALPAPTMTPEQAAAIKETFDKAADAVVNRTGKIRSVLRPGEKLTHFTDQLSKIRTVSEKRKFVLDRMEANGWTLDDEKRFAENCRSIGYDLYSQRGKFKGFVLVEGVNP